MRARPRPIAEFDEGYRRHWDCYSVAVVKGGDNEVFSSFKRAFWAVMEGALMPNLFCVPV